MAASRVSLEELVVAGRELFGPGFSADRAGWREISEAAYWAFHIIVAFWAMRMAAT